MDLSKSWIALKGLSKGEVLADLSADEGEPVAVGVLPKFAMADLPGGWVLILAHAEFVSRNRMYQFSRAGLAVACVEEERGPYSDAWAYEARTELWRVTHDPNYGPDHLLVTGAPPPEFEAIKAELFDIQAQRQDADYIYDIPPQVALSVCGFSLFGLSEGEWPTFTELRERKITKPPAPGLFQRLFRGL